MIRLAVDSEAKGLHFLSRPLILTILIQGGVLTITYVPFQAGTIPDEALARHLIGNLWFVNHCTHVMVYKYGHSYASGGFCRL